MIRTIKPGFLKQLTRTYFAQFENVYIAAVKRFYYDWTMANLVFFVGDLGGQIKPTYAKVCIHDRVHLILVPVPRLTDKCFSNRVLDQAIADYLRGLYTAPSFLFGPHRNPRLLFAYCQEKGICTPLNWFRNSITPAQLSGYQQRVDFSGECRTIQAEEGGRTRVCDALSEEGSVQYHRGTCQV